MQHWTSIILKLLNKSSYYHIMTQCSKNKKIVTINVNIVLDSTQIYRTSNSFKLHKSSFELTIHQNQPFTLSNSSKKAKKPKLQTLLTFKNIYRNINLLRQTVRHFFKLPFFMDFLSTATSSQTSYKEVLSFSTSASTTPLMNFWCCTIFRWYHSSVYLER